MNENNFNKPYDDSTTSSTTNINYNNNYCYYRLPCGYCKILEKACPMYHSNTFIYNDRVCDPPYNLNQVTCGAIKDSDVKY